MINKIVASMLFVSCLFAISLSLMGVQGPISLGPQFRSFLASCSRDFDNFKIEIPSIPSIPTFDTPQGVELVLNFLVSVVNGLSTLINFVITIFNVLISVLEFLFIILKNLIIVRDDIVSQA